jgi:hypothetical protein
MKGLIHGGLSTLLLAIATTGTIVPAMAQSPEDSPVLVASAPLIMANEGAMTFNFTAPFIVNSGVLGSNHFIRVAVVGMSLEDVMISLPSQMERYESIAVVDQNGRTIPAKVSADKRRVAITFNQPVASGNYLQVLFRGVQMQSDGGDTLFYGVSGKRTGIKDEIPIGTARVQIPFRG